MGKEFFAVVVFISKTDNRRLLAGCAQMDNRHVMHISVADQKMLVTEAGQPVASYPVSTSKFEGQVTILYDRGGDTYAVELSRDGELVDRHDEVYFDMLGEVLERLIDDGRWRLIDVNVINAKPPRRRQAVPA